MEITIALALGAIIGVLLGLLGGGGSILAVPALVFGLGLDLEQAIPISLLVIGVASLVGAVPKIREHQVNRRMAGVFAACGMPATFAGSAIGRLLPQSVVMVGFAAVMVVAGIRMLMDRGDTGTACEVGDSGIDWRRCAPRSIP
ncbi:putative membrane protein, partial [Rhodococcus opacus RKJ300 = JCM 13270]